MEQSQEIRNELVDVIMPICHVTTAANLDLVVMQVYLPESIHTDPRLLYLVLLGFLRAGSITNPP